MAQTEKIENGSGSANQLITFTFEYLEDTDVGVQVIDTTLDGDDANHIVELTKDATSGAGWEFVANNPTQIRLTGATYASTKQIRVYRKTDITNKAVHFTAGSAIRAQDLNKANDQVIYSVEEWRDQRVPFYGAKMPDDIDMQTHKIVGLEDADSDGDAVNRKQLGNLIADDIFDDTTQGLQINKSTAGTNSGDQATFTIRDSSKTQKGSVTINEGEGVDVTYTNGNAVISGEDSSKTNKGVVSINEGEGIDVTYTNGDAVISGEDSSKTNKGIVSINEAHAIGVTYTNGDAVISADKSTTSQQGVVRIQEQNNGTNGNPVDVTYTADGEVEIGIADNTIDLAKLKDVDIVTEAEQDTKAGAGTALTDNELLTGSGSSKRHDVIVQSVSPDPTAPSPGGWQTGKLQYQNVPGARVLKLWDGSQWRVVSPVGESFVPTTNTIVRYVDATNGDDTGNNQGFLPHKPLATIEKALDLVNNSSAGDGTVIYVQSGVYKENLPLKIKKQNVSIVGASQRSVFVLPKDETEALKDMFWVDSGSYLQNMTMLGLKVDPTTRDGDRDYSLDNDATYGLPTGQNWAVRFRTDTAPTILKSPFIQNCTHFSDAHLDIANFDPDTFPSTDSQTYSAVAGDQTSAPCAGGFLVDGAACASTSPLRSFVVDAFTQITLDGPGCLVTNNGYAQLVSFFGTFCHYHAKAKNGGQVNLSNCVSDFGTYGLIADGHGDTFATATATAANAGATTVTVGGLTTTSGHHVTATRPLDHMMITIDGNDYGIVSSQQASNGTDWDVTITPALSQNISNTSVAFSLRSYISTGGHTFEFVGVGTHYGNHPDKGGVPIEANQSIELNGGKVWQSSTDHVGKFKAGTALAVNAVAETVDLKSVTIKGTSTPASLKFNSETDAKSVTLKAPTNASLTSYELTLPTGGVAAGKVLQTDASGNLSFEYPVPNGDKGDITVAQNGASWTIDNGAVDDNALATNAVVTAKIQDGAVSTGKIADDAITDAKLADHATTNSSRAVGTNHIKDANVTLAKLESLADANIIVGDSNSRPAAVNVTGDVTISNTGVTTLKSSTTADADRAVGTNHIKDGAVTSAKIADGTIVNDDINNNAAIAGSKISMSLNEVSDVSLGSPTSSDDGKVLTYSHPSGGSGSFSLTTVSGGGGSGASSLNGLSDVDLTTAATSTRNVLVYDSATSKFVAGYAFGAGLGTTTTTTNSVTEANGNLTSYPLAGTNGLYANDTALTNDGFTHITGSNDLDDAPIGFNPGSTWTNNKTYLGVTSTSSNWFINSNGGVGFDAQGQTTPSSSGGRTGNALNDSANCDFYVSLMSQDVELRRAGYKTHTENNVQYLVVRMDYKVPYSNDEDGYPTEVWFGANGSISVRYGDAVDVDSSGNVSFSPLNGNSHVICASGSKVTNTTSPYPNLTSSGGYGYLATPATTTTHTPPTYSVADFPDVEVSSPQNGQVLKYDSGKWKNLADSTGSGSGSGKLIKIGNTQNITGTNPSSVQWTVPTGYYEFILYGYNITFTSALSSQYSGAIDWCLYDAAYNASSPTSNRINYLATKLIYSETNSLDLSDSWTHTHGQQPKWGVSGIPTTTKVNFIARFGADSNPSVLIDTCFGNGSSNSARCVTRADCANGNRIHEIVLHCGQSGTFSNGLFILYGVVV